VLVTGESGTGKELVARAIYHTASAKTSPLWPSIAPRSRRADRERAVRLRARGVYRGRPVLRGEVRAVPHGHALSSTRSATCRCGPSRRSARAFRRRVRAAWRHGDDQGQRADPRRHEQESRKGGARGPVPRGPLLPPADHLDPSPAAACAAGRTSPRCVDYFVGRFAAEYGTPVRFVADQTIRRLQSHNWPGNVRQLENCLRRAVLMCKGDVLLAEHVRFEATPRLRPRPGGRRADRPPAPRESCVETPGVRRPRCPRQRHRLDREVAHCPGTRQVRPQQVHTARMLGISRNTLRHRIEKYGLEERGEDEGQGRRGEGGGASGEGEAPVRAVTGCIAPRCRTEFHSVQVSFPAARSQGRNGIPFLRTRAAQCCSSSEQIRKSFAGFVLRLVFARGRPSRWLGSARAMSKGKSRGQRRFLT